MEWLNDHDAVSNDCDALEIDHDTVSNDRDALEIDHEATILMVRQSKTETN